MKSIGRALGAVVVGLLFTIPLAVSSSAQSPSTWPQRPVKFIVSLGPGSGADIGARLLAERLTTRWNQPVVVENRPGGDAVVAINAFIGAKDDHTLLYSPTSSFTAHPYVLVVVPASLNVASVADLMAMIKAQPGKLNYSTATGMTDVIFEGYFKSAGLQITRVPYRDVVAPLTDLGESRIQAYVGALAIVQPHVQAGRVKLIAITNAQGAPNYPDTPTVAKAGFPDITFDGLIGLFGPKDMAAAARERIAADVRAVLGDETVKSRFVATSQLISPGTSAEFAASIEEQRSKLAAIAQKLGVKAAQ